MRLSQHHPELAYADDGALRHEYLELGRFCPLFEGELRNLSRQLIVREQAPDATEEVT
jgi:hypothetical protein